MAGWFFGAAGVFTICCVAFDWDFFMNSARARFFTSIWGRTGTRIFYGCIGTTLLVLAFMV